MNALSSQDLKNTVYRSSTVRACIQSMISTAISEKARLWYMACIKWIVLGKVEQWIEDIGVDRYTILALTLG